MEINRRDFITKVSAIAALSVLPSSFVAAMGNEKVEKAKPKYPTLKCDVVVVGAGPGGVPAAIAAAIVAWTRASRTCRWRISCACSTRR